MYRLLPFGMAFFLFISSVQAAKIETFETTDILLRRSFSSDSNHSSRSRHCPKKCLGRKGTKGHAGNAGPTGLTGPAGNLSANYISSYNVSEQRIDADSTPHPINFSNDSTVKGITRISSNTFKVPNKGRYLIGWTISSFADPSCESTGGPCSDNTISIFLLNVTTNSAIPPFPSGQYVQGPPKEASGQTIVDLEEGDIIQLNVIVEPGATMPFSPNTFKSPTLFIMQIKP